MLRPTEVRSSYRRSYSCSCAECFKHLMNSKLKFANVATRLVWDEGGAMRLEDKSIICHPQFFSSNS